MNAERRYLMIRYICISGTILFGSGSTIIAKRLDLSNFYYPLFQTGLMFLGMALCSGFIKIFTKKQQKLRPSLINASKEDEINKTCFEKTGKFAFCLTALFDFMGSFMEYFSYNLLKASSIVTFKMMVIIFIITYKKFVLKKPIYRHQILGLVFLGIGFSIVGLEVLFNSKNDIIWDKYAGLGICMMVSAQVFNSLVIIFQEYQMNKIAIRPQEVVVIQGITGLLVCSILYAPMHYLFRYIQQDIAEISDPIIKMSESIEICMLIITFLFFIGLLNFFQVTTIKIADSLALCTIDSGRVILVWTFAIAFSFESALPLEIVGGGSLILGILIYNEVLVIPCCGLRKSAKASMKENEVYRELKIKDREWQTKLDSILA